ncbi:DUF4097 family beta strand repeat-containing protein [Gemmatimonas sp.]|jgi:DUF4097 and DUF4098 domain-containing protein YvlB|uniref:DUF4097 family beta strand repeat-containing protein n=1 Tax=Gemmatimonas sp. TaxID=1962908 RepID=UPI0037C0A9DC
MNRHRTKHRHEPLPLFVGAALLTTVLCPAPVSAQSRDTSVRLSAGAVVDITMRTGRLIVHGIDGSTGSVRASGANYELRSTGVTLTLQSRDHASRSAMRDRDADREDTIELNVPRGVRLVVSTLSADAEVRDISGSVEMRSTSGDLQLTNISGRTIIETISGDVRTTATRTLLRAKTVSGDVRVREAEGDLELSTTSGDMSVSGAQIGRFVASSISGNVQFDGLFTDDARVQVNTHSGDVSLRLPDGAHGQAALSTVNGDFVPGGPITLLPGNDAARRGRNAQRFAFGTGSSPGLLLDITTFNGDVRLLRGTRP